MRNPFEDIADTVDERDIGGERVIDFDIDTNSDYEIQSSVALDDQDRVKEAAVRFGMVEERPDLNIDRGLLERAFSTKVRETAGGSKESVESDFSHFKRNVPHIRVERENVEEFGLEPPTADEFAETVQESAEFTEEILRGDDETIDNEIDRFL